MLLNIELIVCGMAVPISLQLLLTFTKHSLFGLGDLECQEEVILTWKAGPARAISKQWMLQLPASSPSRFRGCF